MMGSAAFSHALGNPLDNPYISDMLEVEAVVLRCSVKKVFI